MKYKPERNNNIYLILSKVPSIWNINVGWNKYIKIYKYKLRKNGKVKK